MPFRTKHTRIWFWTSQILAKFFWSLLIGRIPNGFVDNSLDPVMQSMQRMWWILSMAFLFNALKVYLSECFWRFDKHTWLTHFVRCWTSQIHKRSESTSLLSVIWSLQSTEYCAWHAINLKNVIYIFNELFVMLPGCTSQVILLL